MVRHASLHGTEHDGVDRAPRQSGERTDCLGGGTGLKQFDGKPGQQGGDLAVAIGPGSRQLFDRAIAVLELGNSGSNDDFELAGVQVTPLAFALAIDRCSLGRIGGVGPDLSLL